LGVTLCHYPKGRHRGKRFPELVSPSPPPCRRWGVDPLAEEATAGLQSCPRSTRKDLRGNSMPEPIHQFPPLYQGFSCGSGRRGGFRRQREGAESLPRVRLGVGLSFFSLLGGGCMSSPSPPRGGGGGTPNLCRPTAPSPPSGRPVRHAPERHRRPVRAAAIPPSARPLPEGQMRREGGGVSLLRRSPWTPSPWIARHWGTGQCGPSGGSPPHSSPRTQRTTNEPRQARGGGGRRRAQLGTPPASARRMALPVVRA